MKFNKAIIAMIVVLVILNVADARKAQSKVAKKSGKGFFDRIFKDWNNVVVEINGVSTYKFNCKIKDVELGGKALGVAFDGFEQITTADQSGFMAYIQRLYKIDGQDLQKPVLDYRFIQGCVISDNSKESSGDWRLEMNLQANEEYNNFPSSNQNKGNSWKMKIHMAAADRNEAMAFKQSLIKNCQIRNGVMNQLKDAAIAAGNNYNSLYFGFQNREQSLADMAALSEKADSVIDDVKDQQVKEQTDLDNQISANQKLLDDALAQIQATAAKKQTTEAETEELVSSLEEAQRKLVQLTFSQTTVKTALNKAQHKLSEAYNLQNKQKKASADLDSESSTVSTDNNAAQKALADEIAALKAKAAAKAKEAADALAKIAADKANVNKQLSNTADTIKALLSSTKAKRAQIESIDKQLVTLKALITDLQQKIDSQRSTAAQMNAALKKLAKQKEETEKDLADIQEQGEKELKDLADRLQKQIALVHKLDKERAKKENYFIEQAQADITKANADFVKALKAINDQAAITSVETTQAQQTVLSGGHVQHLHAVVSQEKSVMKMSLLRLAKYNRQMQRLARARLAQITQVRQQQKKLKNKLRSHKHLSA